MSYNTIKVKKYGNVIEEFVAAEALYPGHLLAMNSDGEVKKHDGNGTSVLPPMFALEDELQGNGIDDAYAADDEVQVWIPYRGDLVYAVLADGETAVIGSELQSNADGTLSVHSADSTDYDGAIVGVAVEALDLSGSSGEESSGALGYDKRILIRIV